MQNMLILTIRLTPVTLTLFGRSRSYYPDAPISYANISMKFREDRTMGKGHKGCDGQTDRRTSIVVFDLLNDESSCHAY